MKFLDSSVGVVRERPAIPARQVGRSRTTPTAFHTLLITLIAATLFASNVNAQSNERSPMSCPDLLNKTLPNIANKPQSLCDYSGNVILVANTASKCGFTGQYKDLQALYDQYKDQGFVVLGFPSNDFAGQEPLSNEEVVTFCERNYGVDFPLFAKSHVKKKNANPLYQDLIQKTGKAPKWNFGKYLISRGGDQVRFFGTLTNPGSGKIKKAIEKFLSEPRE